MRARKAVTVTEYEVFVIFAREGDVGGVTKSRQLRAICHKIEANNPTITALAPHQKPVPPFSIGVEKLAARRAICNR